MKRFLSILIALSILTASLCTMALSIVADESTEETTPEAPNYRVPVAGLYDDKLVAYYNFLGETLEEQLADKAPAGETNDILSATENVTVANGVATVPSTTKEYLSWESLEGDIADLAGKTLYMEFTAEGHASQFANDLISFNGDFRYWLAKNSTTEKYTFGGGIGSKPTTAGYKLSVDSSTPSAPAKDWYYVAISFDLTDDKLTITVYNSDNGTDYIESVTVFQNEFKPENLLRGDAMLIGKANKTVGDRGMSINLNQLRLYNAVLNANEVRNLSYVTPGQTTEKLPEAGDNPGTPDTPAVPRPERLPIAGLYDENLIAYYDFNGDNDTVKGMDKAPAGETNDDLELSNVVVNNGIAYVSSEKGSYLSINTKSGDTADLAGKTIYVVFTATGFADPYSADIISAQKTVRYWLNKGSGDDNFKFGGGIGATPTAAGYKLSTNAASPVAPSDTWYYLALTFEMTETELIITAYNSADGKEYVATADSFVGDQKPADLARVSALVFGKAAASTDDRGISYYFQEIRIYDKVLNADEIATLVYTVPGQTTTLPQPPADTEPTVPDVTDPTNPEVTEPTNPNVTEAPTAEPSKPTAAPTTEKTPATESTPTTENSSTTANSSNSGKSGCGAAVAPLALIAVISVGAAMIVRKKD